MRAVARWLSLLTATCVACAGAPPGETARTRLGGDVLATAAPAAVDTPVWTPPDAWRTISDHAFERLVLEHLPDGRATRIDGRALPDVLAALDDPSPVSVRAAVLLARSQTSHAGRILLQRLEKRVLGPERNSDVADVLAAAALLKSPFAAQAAPRLAALAVAPDPHPDLEVRVECAATALAHGQRQVVPFLLQVLRIDTWDGEQDERDFAYSPTTAWARGRASRALSEAAGLPLTYQPDGSIEHRQDEARRLAQALAR